MDNLASERLKREQEELQKDKTAVIVSALSSVQEQLETLVKVVENISSLFKTEIS